VPLSYVAFVRAYERAAPNGPVLEPVSFPPHFDRWLDSRFRDRYVTSGKVGFFPLPPMSVAFEDGGGALVSITISRAVVDSPHIGVCDSILWVEGGNGDIPDALHTRSWELLTGEQPLITPDTGEKITLSEIWDGAVREVLDVEPRAWRKTGFGSLNVFVADATRASAIVAASTTEGARAVVDGRGHHVVLDRNRCTVVLPPGTDQERFRGGYLLLTALLGRSRHFSWTLLADVAALAEDCDVTAGSAAASSVLTRAVELQRRAVIARRELRAADYLGDPSLIALFHQGAPVALAEQDRQALDDALEGLDRLVNGVFAVASDRAQQRLNQVGFTIALISVLLAAPGLTNLLAASPADRTWIYLVWALSVLVLVVVVAASRARWPVRRPGRPDRPS
jgi:hypothetical protein